MIRVADDVKVSTMAKVEPEDEKEDSELLENSIEGSSVESEETSDVIQETDPTEENDDLTEE